MLEDAGAQPGMTRVIEDCEMPNQTQDDSPEKNYAVTGHVLNMRTNLPNILEQYIARSMACSKLMVKLFPGN